MIGQGSPSKTPDRGKDSPGLRTRYVAWLTAMLIGIAAAVSVRAPLSAQTAPPSRAKSPMVPAGPQPPLEFSSPAAPPAPASPALAPSPSPGPAPDRAPAASTLTPGPQVAPDPGSEDLLDLRLRIVWGSGQSRQWAGSIRIDSGRLSDFRLLGLEADEPGSMDCMEREIRIQQPSARAYDGLDFRVVAPRSARLVVELAPQGADEPPRRVDRPLADFVDGFHKEPLDDQENRLLIRRSPGDQLRVTFARDSLVFAPGEQFTFDVQPH